MNEQQFIQIVKSCQEGIITQLIKLTKDKQEAKDVLSVAMTKLWFQIAANKLKNQKNLCGLLYTIAKNEWLKDKKKQQKMQELNETNSKWLMEEMPIEEFDDSVDSKRREAMKKAFARLGDKCKTLLTRYHIDDEKLKLLVEELGYNSYDVIRAARYQCTKQLKTKFKEELQKL